ARVLETACVAGLPCVVLPGVACGVGLASSAWVWLCARCFSICGTLYKYCQAISTKPDRMTARVVLRLSVIVSRSRHSIRVPARDASFGALSVKAEQRLAQIVEHG